MSESVLHLFSSIRYAWWVARTDRQTDDRIYDCWNTLELHISAVVAPVRVVAVVVVAAAVTVAVNAVITAEHGAMYIQARCSE